MVWREVRKEGFGRGYYLLIFLSAAAGTWMFTLSPGNFPQVTNPTLLQSILLGVAVAATAIIPGVDPAVFLTSLGFYEMYVHALATVELSILGPMVLGLAAGAVGISALISGLFRRWYTATYSVIFGIFLSMIPNMLTAECALGRNMDSAVSVAVLVLGFLISWYLGDLEKHNAWLAKKRNRG